MSFLLQPQADPMVASGPLVDGAGEAVFLRAARRTLRGPRGRSPDPLHLFAPHILKRQAARFIGGFRGKVLYAVKANPHPDVLKAATEAGVLHFDVASIREVECVLAVCPEAELYFMHPVKSREAIRRAYALGVRRFAYDHRDELVKIQEECGNADDLTLILRLAVPAEGAVYALKDKFGADADSATFLLAGARAAGARVGISFHVGSQSMDPRAYERAIALAAQVADGAGVTLDILDVGGGFPVPYPGLVPPPLEDYFGTIHRAVVEHGFQHAELLAEPGRALVAQSGALAVRVELRRGLDLYLNDGTYGSLFDAGVPHWPFPVTAISGDGRKFKSLMADYRAFGPTCDSLDVMPGPFSLPVDLALGDWLLFETIGAYGFTMQTRFNGFFSDELQVISERPKGGRSGRRVA